jgi:general stress protein 26
MLGNVPQEQPMPEKQDIEERCHVERLLAAARKTIAEVAYCWVVTRAVDGGANARVVRVFFGEPGDDEWTRRFLTLCSARKTAEMRADPRVTLAFQHSSGEAYVALVGRAELIDDKAVVRSLWQPSWDDLYPAGFIDANMIVAKHAVERIELHIRGVTAEPWGHGRTLVERREPNGWRLMQGGR